MNTNPMASDIRAEMKRLLTDGVRTQLEEITHLYFTQPATAESRQILLEAVAESLYDLTKADLTGQGVLRTFALELLDKEIS